MSPLEFMQRLVALVPRPQLHLFRFDALASNSKRRARVVPQGPEVMAQATEAAMAGECEAQLVQGQTAAYRLGAAAQAGLRSTCSTARTPAANERSSRPS